MIKNVTEITGNSENSDLGVMTFHDVIRLANVPSAVARVSEAPPEISRGAPHTLLAYYYELQ